MTNQSLVTVDVGGSSYPYKTEPRCFVCNHVRRLEIEKSIADGRTYGRIVEDLALRDELTERNLHDHVANQHLPLNAPAVRLVAQQQAKEVGWAAVEPLVAGVAANLSLAHRIVDRVRHRLDAEQEEPTIRDGLAALKLIMEVERTSDGASVTEWEEAAIATLEVVRAVMTEEQLTEFGRRMNRWRRSRQTAQ